MKRIILAILAVTAAVSLSGAQRSIFIETEGFSDKGGWQVDQQFMDLMGSPYLIAHGMGIPVADASTTFDVRKKGVYHVYVRTFNWTSPWTSEEGPGAFTIAVNGKTLQTTLGTRGDKWFWQYAGSVEIPSGQNTVSLHDLGGFDGRCDAIWLTSDKDNIPPEEPKSLEAFRRQVGALPMSPSDGGSYDLVVVGAGIGGMCTAVSAARLGLKVALVSDRPKIGGNNSSEIRVHLGGRIEMDPYPALGRMLREFGHSKLGNAQPAQNYEDQKKDAFIAAEPNVKLFSCYRAVSVNMASEDMIGSVVIRNTMSGEELTLTSPLFSDCTGDGNLGFLAGADWRMGRESRDEFGESMAPDHGDQLTMGSSVQWYSVQTPGASSFPEFQYGLVFNEENCEKVTMGEWTWETGMNFDQINDFERIRDYGMLVIYSNWSFLKNHYSSKAKYADRELGWVAYVAGKRESRRLMGDYILKQDDIDKQVFHEDASFTTTWHIDIHSPERKNSLNFPGEEFKASTKNNPIHPYAVPYRCLYSRNINNLFMAGRDISVTHVTLGTTRLMRTIAMMGEVVGMAASICKEQGVLPRGVYQHYLPELKELMKKGVARDVDLPDNQHFNEGGYLKKPKDIIFTEQVDWEKILDRYAVDPSVSEVLLVKCAEGSEAYAEFYVKGEHGWVLKTQGVAFIGRSGLGKKKEGDGGTPEGDFTVKGAFGIQADPGTKLEYLPIRKGIIACDEQGQYYNSIVDTAGTGISCKGEDMSAIAPQYDYGMTIDFNPECIYPAGSNIFVHCKGASTSTAGCVALDKEMMLEVLKNASPGMRVCIHSR